MKYIVGTKLLSHKQEKSRISADLGFYLKTFSLFSSGSKSQVSHLNKDQLKNFPLNLKKNVVLKKEGAKRLQTLYRANQTPLLKRAL